MKKKIINVLLLIGVIFSTFHDFVFYKLDPCMKDINLVLKFEKGNSNDPFCDIHHDLHSPVVINLSKINFLEYISEEIRLNKPFKEISIKTDIFKPPIELS